MNDTQSNDGAEVPRKFYKYRSLAGEASDHAEKIICQHEIFFPAPSSFNDPFDCRPAFSFEGTDDEIVNDYIRIARKHGPPITDEDLRRDAMQMFSDPTRNPRNPAVRAVIEDEHARFITSKVGVLCVSTIDDDILMWSHYADCHRGICLEFDGMGALMAHAQKVSYTKERRHINSYRDSEVEAMGKALLTKADHWSYEREWRLIAYQQGPGIQKFHPNNLTGIIVGAQATLDIVQKVRTWASKSTSALKLYKARVSRETYALEIEELDP